jgi:formylglycine-generating enzyme
LREIHSRNNFHERVFPIILKGASVYDPIDWADFLEHWEKKSKELGDKLNRIEKTAAEPLYSALNDYADYRRLLARQLNILTDMNTLTEDVHVDADFESILDLIKLVETKPPATKAQHENTRQPEVHPDIKPTPASGIAKPDWATEFGADKFGHYADLEFKGVIQRFRWILPGTFLMGSPTSELGRYDDEIQHQVTLTKGFWLADTACTQAFWLAVMDENPAGFKDNVNNPVENISWHGVQQFIATLNAFNHGLQACLPSEAEWEYACRAGTTTPFAFGENITPALVNYNGNQPYAGCNQGLYREKTVPIKALPSNLWGLYGMHGNVWEWCQDWYGSHSENSVRDPTGLRLGIRRVLRGGSWLDGGWSARSACRCGNAPDDRFRHVGFRFALGQTAK